MPSSTAINASQIPDGRVGRAIAAASARTGIDFDYLVDQARLESNFDPSAKARTSSASGLYQFTQQTWLGTVKQHGGKHGMDWAADAIEQRSNGSFNISNPGLAGPILALREQPEAAALMAGEFAADNTGYLQERLGRPVEQVDLYLAHFLGAAGAAKFLEMHDRNPDAPAAPDFAKAAAANNSIFYSGTDQPRSYAAIRALFQKKLDGGGGSTGGSGSPAPASTGHKWSVSTASASRSVGNTMQMRSFEPMPGGLSVAFAQRAYERLQNLGGGMRA